MDSITQECLAPPPRNRRWPGGCRKEQAALAQDG